MLVTHPYEEISEFGSPQVFICSKYNGIISGYKKQPVVIYACFAEKFDVSHMTHVLEIFKDSFTILLVHRDYPIQELEQKHNCKIITIKYAYAYYSKILPYQDLYDPTNDLEKKFLSFNNRTQWNRQALMQFLIKFNLMDDFYFSYRSQDRFNVGAKKLYDTTNEIIGNTWFNQDLDLEKLYQLLPITISQEKSDASIDLSWRIVQDSFYQNSFASFVNETYIDENFNVHFTEKLMKPIANGHVFLLFSSAGALDALHKLGFETFGDVIDESYDQIENPQLRFEYILKETQRICNFNLSELSKIKQHVWPRIVHNHDWFWNQMPKLYNDEMVNVKIQIQDILNQQRDLLLN